MTLKKYLFNFEKNAYVTPSISALLCRKGDQIILLDNTQPLQIPPMEVIWTYDTDTHLCYNIDVNGTKWYISNNNQGFHLTCSTDINLALMIYITGLYYSCNMNRIASYFCYTISLVPTLPDSFGSTVKDGRRIFSATRPRYHANNAASLLTTPYLGVQNNTVLWLSEAQYLQAIQGSDKDALISIMANEFDETTFFQTFLDPTKNQGMNNPLFRRDPSSNHMGIKYVEKGLYYISKAEDHYIVLDSQAQFVPKTDDNPTQLWLYEPDQKTLSTYEKLWNGNRVKLYQPPKRTVFETTETEYPPLEVNMSACVNYDTDCVEGPLSDPFILYAFCENFFDLDTCAEFTYNKEGQTISVDSGKTIYNKCLLYNAKLGMFYNIALVPTNTNRFTLTNFIQINNDLWTAQIASPDFLICTQPYKRADLEAQRQVYNWDRIDALRKDYADEINAGTRVLFRPTPQDLIYNIDGKIKNPPGGVSDSISCPWYSSCSSIDQSRIVNYCSGIDALGYPRLNTDVNCRAWSQNLTNAVNAGQAVDNFCAKYPLNYACVCQNVEETPYYSKMLPLFKALQNCGQCQALPSPLCWAPMCTTIDKAGIPDLRLLNYENKAKACDTNINICQQVIDASHAGHDVDISNNTFEQICGISLPSGPTVTPSTNSPSSTPTVTPSTNSPSSTPTVTPSSTNSASITTILTDYFQKNPTYAYIAAGVALVFVIFIITVFVKLLFPSKSD